MLYVIFTQAGNFIWTYFFLPALLLASLWLSIGCKGLQFRRFGFAMKQTIGKAFSKHDKKSSGISPFQAASTALGSTVGTGNIVGTAQAIAMAGPGALFWLWAAAFASMIVKYAEIVLAVHFREKTPGYGPMDYISHGLGSKRVAMCYAFLAVLSSLAMGNITQASSITDAVTAAGSMLSFSGFTQIAGRISVGFALCGITLLLLSGGAKRIGEWAEKLVPFMIIIFIFVSTTVILKNIFTLPGVLGMVLKEAFKPGSICGGIAGISTAQCIQWGFRRSAFSNEAGLGTSAIAHASAETENVAYQGLWGIFEVFADTIVICSCTAFCILCSGIDIPWGQLQGSELFMKAISTVFGYKLSSILLAVFIGLFAYTSIAGWAVYGTQCTSYIFGDKASVIYKVIFCLLLIVGSIMPTEKVWGITDTVNAMMSVPNLISLLLLSPIVFKLSRDSFS